MSVQVKHRRDTAANISAFTPAQGELIVDTTNNRVIVGDGATAGGFAMAKLSDVVLRRAVSDASVTVAVTDRVVAYTALTAARTATLPAAASFPVATVLRIVDESGACSAANTITIARVGADTVNGAASFVLNGPYMSVALVSDGVSKWTLLNNETVDSFSYAGFGTAPDPSNVVSAYGSSALFNGASFSFTVNKSASANVASVIFEDNFSLRAQVGLLNNDNLTFKVSPNGSTYLTGLTIDGATGAVTLGNARTAVSDANYTALTTDREIAYTAITAARTVSLPAASAFPAGHALVVVDESGAVSATNAINIVRAGADTIGGQTGAAILTPYGHCRLLSNGVNGWVVTGRSVNIRTFSSSGTYVPSPGLTKLDVYLVGGGGGGGGGARVASGTAASGGGGGGGGGGNFGTFTAAQIGASQVVTIGAGGTAGAAATSDSTAGGNGGGGGSTTFGSLLTAFNGGGGAGGQIGAASAGGGAGSPLGAGGNATGSSATVASGGSSSGASGAASGTAVAIGASSGGAGSSAAGAAFNSGTANCGNSGGGSGGGIATTPAAINGGNAGIAVSGAGTFGGSGAGASGGSPSLSTQPWNLFFSSGGAGGASGTNGGFSGGAGGTPGGGGGGGGSTLNTFAAGAGGAGGAGYAILVEYF